MTGTTVIPRDPIAPYAFARSLLAITTGLRLFASLPGTGSTSTCHTHRAVPSAAVLSHASHSSAVAQARQPLARM